MYNFIYTHSIFMGRGRGRTEAIQVLREQFFPRLSNQSVSMIVASRLVNPFLIEKKQTIIYPIYWCNSALPMAKMMDCMLLQTKTDGSHLKVTQNKATCPTSYCTIHFSEMDT